jgi:hypothetical protein
VAFQLEWRQGPEVVRYVEGGIAPFAPLVEIVAQLDQIPRTMSNEDLARQWWVDTGNVYKAHHRLKFDLPGWSWHGSFFDGELGRQLELPGLDSGETR